MWRPGVEPATCWLKVCVATPNVQHLCSARAIPLVVSDTLVAHYGRTLSDASMLYFADVFIFFMAALVGQTAERIFTKLSHVVDITCYL